MPKEDKTLDLLVENFALLQKKLVDLTFSLDALAKEVSELLALFKETAEKFSGKEGKSLTEKLENIEEQNKTIARSLLLMQEEKIKEEKPAAPRRISEFRF